MKPLCGHAVSYMQGIHQEAVRFLFRWAICCSLFSSHQEVQTA